MKTHILLFAFTLLGFGIINISEAHDPFQGLTYTVRIESVDQREESIAFKAAYAFHDSTTEPTLQFIEEETPFEIAFSATNFLGMFQSSTEGVKIKVSLKRFRDGKLEAHAYGTGSFNFLHGEPKGIGYGFPEYTVLRSLIGGETRIFQRSK